MHRPSEAVGHGKRRGAGRPTEKVAVGLEGVAEVHALETRTGVAGVPVPGGPGPVEHDHGMMDDAGISGAQLNRGHVPRPGQRQGDHEVAEQIASACSQGIGLRHLHHQIRYPQLPPLGPLRRLGRLLRVAFGRPFPHPALNHPDLGIAQSPHAREIAVPGLRFPRRHVALRGHLGNQVRPLPDIAVGEQAERRRFPGPVAGGAVPEDDGSDILVEGHRSPGCVG